MATRQGGAPAPRAPSGPADCRTAGPRPLDTAEPGPSTRLLLNGEQGWEGSEGQGRASPHRMTTEDPPLCPTAPCAVQGLLRGRSFWKGLEMHRMLRARPEWAAGPQGRRAGGGPSVASSPRSGHQHCRATSQTKRSAVPFHARPLHALLSSSLRCPAGSRNLTPRRRALGTEPRSWNGLHALSQAAAKPRTLRGAGLILGT